MRCCQPFSCGQVQVHNLVIMSCTLLFAWSACGGHSKATICATVDAATSPAWQPPPSGIDLFGVVGPPADCVVCLRNNCGKSMNACANSATCREGLLCTMGTCAPGTLAKGGGFASMDLGCVTGCFHNDLASALQLVGAAACITQQCSAICSAAVSAPAVVAGIDAGSGRDSQLWRGPDGEATPVPVPVDAAAIQGFDAEAVAEVAAPILLPPL
jgi:hypothetical protein